MSLEPRSRLPSQLFRPRNSALGLLSVMVQRFLLSLPFKHRGHVEMSDSVLIARVLSGN